MSDSAEALLGEKPPTPEQAESAEAVLGPRPITDYMGAGTDAFFAAPQPGAGAGLASYAGQIVHQFGVGFRSVYASPLAGASEEPEYDPVSKQYHETFSGLAKRYGFFYDPGEPKTIVSALTKIPRQMVEGVLRPLAMTVDASARFPYAMARGMATTDTPWALVGGPAAALFEGAIPEIGAAHAPLPVRIVPRPIRDLQAAYDLGITTERESMQPNEGLARTLPTGAPSPTERVEMFAQSAEMPEGVAMPQAEPANVHEAALRFAPDAVTAYEEAGARKAELGSFIREAKEAGQKTIRDEIEALMEPVDGDVSALRPQQQRRLERLQGELGRAVTEDTPEVAAARREMMTADEEMRDNVTERNAAYARAREMFPPEELPATTPHAAVEPERLLVAARDPDGKVFVGKPGQIHADLVYNAANAEMGFVDARGQFLTREEAFATLGPERDTLRVQGELDAADYEMRVAPTVDILAQRRQAISTEAARDLRAAGVPDDIASAGGRLWQSYYEAKAARFEGALGTAREISDRETMDVVAGETRPGTRGSYSAVRNILTWTEYSDASTFIHETGHKWLTDMLKDAEHELAPESLKADAQTVRDWWTERGVTSPTKQQELFARTFERYMMEGVAPSARLAGVFEKFKQWIMDIYRSVRLRNAPLNDAMRGVFDRLLAGPERTPFVEEPREPQPGRLGEAHTRESATVPPEEAEARANEMRAERDAVSEALPPELNNARRRSRLAGDEGIDAPGRGEEGAVLARGEGGAPGSDAVGEGAAAAGGDVSEGGASFAVKGEIPGGPNEPFSAGADRFRSADGAPIIRNIASPADIDTIVARAEGPRGTLTDAQTIRLADAIGTDFKELNPERIGAAYSAEQIGVLERLLVGAETEVRDRMVEVAQGGGKPLDLAEAIVRLQMIQSKAMQTASDWGRQGQALQRIKAATGTNAVRAMDTLLRKTVNMDYDTLYQMAAIGANLDTPRQIGKVVNDVNRGQMTLLGRQVSWWMMNGFLSNPITHAAYAAGNELRTAIMHPATVGVAGAIGEVRARLGVGPRDRVYLEEAGATLSGMMKGSMDGIRPAWESAKASHQLPLPGATLAENLNVTQQSSFMYAPPVGKFLENTVGLASKNVALIHQYARYQFYTQRLYELSMRQALSEGLNGPHLETRIAELRQNPPPEMMADSRLFADTMIYQRPTRYNALSRNLSRWTDDYAVAKVMFPFVKIGFEMARETMMKGTPAGLLDREVRRDLLMRNSGAAFDEAWAKQTVGIGMIGTGLYLASQSTITGAGPPVDKPQERQQWLLKYQPYSVYIGPWRIPYSGLGPQANLLKLSADIWETHAHATPQEAEDIAMGYYHAFRNIVLDEGFFKSAINLVQAVEEPKTYGLRFVENLATAAVPFGVGTAAVNRYFIDPHNKENAPGVEGVFDALRGRMPFASWDVNNQIDIFGNPISARGMGYVPYEGDRTVAWLNRLGIGPGRVDRSAMGVRLTEDQFNQYEQVAGRLTKQYLDALVANGVENYPRGAQIELLGQYTEEARKLARVMVSAGSMNTTNSIPAQAAQIKTQKWGETPPRHGRPNP